MKRPTKADSIDQKLLPPVTEESQARQRMVAAELMTQAAADSQALKLGEYGSAKKAEFGIPPYYFDPKFANDPAAQAAKQKATVPNPEDRVDFLKKEADLWAVTKKQEILQDILAGRQRSPADSTYVDFKTKSEPKPPPDEAGALLDEIDKDMKRIRNHIGADEETTLQDIEAEIKESSWANDPRMIILRDRIKKNTAKLSRLSTAVRTDTTNNEPRMSLHPQPTSENNKPGITREQAIQELRRRGKLK